jgi:hypothetical protein
MTKLEVICTGFLHFGLHPAMNIRRVEISLQGVEMSLRGVEISLRGVEIPLQGVEISLRGVEIPLRGVEMSLRHKNSPFVSLGEASVFYGQQRQRNLCDCPVDGLLCLLFPFQIW